MCAATSWKRPTPISCSVETRSQAPAGLIQTGYRFYLPGISLAVGAEELAASA